MVCYFNETVKILKDCYNFDNLCQSNLVSFHYFLNKVKIHNRQLSDPDMSICVFIVCVWSRGTLAQCYYSLSAQQRLPLFLAVSLTVLLVNMRHL